MDKPPSDNPARLKLAIQKSGRLTDHSLDLMTKCGLKYSRGKDQLMCYGENMPLDVLFLRDDDIPDLVEESDSVSSSPPPACDGPLDACFGSCLFTPTHRSLQSAFPGLDLSAFRLYRALRDPLDRQPTPLPSPDPGCPAVIWGECASRVGKTT